MKRLVLAAAMAVFVSAPALAATDGVLGTTSSGTMEARVTIQAPQRQMLITGLQDFDWGPRAYGATLEPKVNNNICVYSTAPGTYLLSIETRFYQSGAPTGFVLTRSGGSETIPYTILFEDFDGHSLTETGTNNTFIQKHAMTPSLTPGCGFEKATLTITPDNTNAATQTPGAYVSQLTIFVEAE